MVQRKFSLTTQGAAEVDVERDDDATIGLANEANTVLRTKYSATTNRMLRVAVNGFMESLGVTLQIMEELDVEVLEAKAPSEIP